MLQTQVARPRRKPPAAVSLRLRIRAAQTTFPERSFRAVSLRDTLIAAIKRFPALGAFGVVVNRVTVSFSAGALRGGAAGRAGGCGGGGCSGGGGAGTGLSIAICAVASLR